MCKIRQKKERNKTLSEFLEQDSSTKIALMKHYLEIILMLVNELMEDEVSSLAGERYSRDKTNEGRYNRWGSNPGSVRLGEDKVRINVPRVYDYEKGQNVSLNSYKELRSNEADEYKLLKGMSINCLKVSYTV